MINISLRQGVRVLKKHYSSGSFVEQRLKLSHFEGSIIP